MRGCIKLAAQSSMLFRREGPAADTRVPKHPIDPFSGETGPRPSESGMRPSESGMRPSERGLRPNAARRCPRLPPQAAPRPRAILLS